VGGISMGAISGILRENRLAPYMGMDRVANGVHLRKDPEPSGLVRITVHHTDENVIVATAERIWDCLTAQGYVLSGNRGDQWLSVLRRDARSASRQHGGTGTTP